MTWLILLAGVVAIAASMVLLGDRCPRCRRFLALRKTGVVKEEDKATVRTTVGESRCRYCGYNLWRPEPEQDEAPRDGGGPAAPSGPG